MRLQTILLASIMALASCQSFKPEPRYKGRRIASTPILKSFLQEIAARSAKGSKKYTVDQLEKKIIDYIKKRDKNLPHGNWSQIGISEDQAKQMNNLYDDLSHMPKVRKWVTENITDIIRLDRKFAKEAYEAINNGTIAFINPYKSVNKRISASRQSNLPFTTMDTKKKRVLENIIDLPDSSLRKEYNKLVREFQLRANKEPAVFANGLESIESSANITKMTGVNAVGSGCNDFNKKAAPSVLSSKADVDARTEAILADQIDAISKRLGIKVKSYKDLPINERLTRADVDNARIQAFQDSLGYSKTEAKSAYSRLQRKPCSVY